MTTLNLDTTVDTVCNAQHPLASFRSEIYLILPGDALEIGSSHNPGRVDSTGGRTSGSRSDTKRRANSPLVQDRRNGWEVSESDLASGPRNRS